MGRRNGAAPAPACRLADTGFCQVQPELDGLMGVEPRVSTATYAPAGSLAAGWGAPRISATRAVNTTRAKSTPPTHSR